MVRLARTRTRLENRFVLRALSEGDRSHPDTCVSRQPGWVGTGDERFRGSAVRDIAVSLRSTAPPVTTMDAGELN